MAEAASSAKLRKAFQHHLRETEGHVARLEKAFHLLGQSPTTKTRDAMKGLIAEGGDIISASGNDSVRDAALIAAAQRVEHYEISAYGSPRTFAQQLGRSEVATLLEQTLEEEHSADATLNDIAQASVNKASAAR
jgi:ferritin-like metal-binding protein YciE